MGGWKLHARVIGRPMMCRGCKRPGCLLSGCVRKSRCVRCESAVVTAAGTGRTKAPPSGPLRAILCSRAASEVSIAGECRDAFSRNRAHDVPTVLPRGHALLLCLSQANVPMIERVVSSCFFAPGALPPHHRPAEAFPCSCSGVRLPLTLILGQSSTTIRTLPSCGPLYLRGYMSTRATHLCFSSFSRRSVCVATDVPNGLLGCRQFIQAAPWTTPTPASKRTPYPAPTVLVGHRLSTMHLPPCLTLPVAVIWQDKSEPLPVSSLRPPHFLRASLPVSARLYA